MSSVASLWSPMAAYSARFLSVPWVLVLDFLKNGIATGLSHVFPRTASG